MPHNIKGLKKISVSKRREGFDMPVTESDVPSFPPSFHVSDTQIPEVKKWEVGKNYYMVVEVRQTEKEDREGEPVRASFDIVKYKALTGKALKDMTDDELELEQGKALGN